MGLDDPKEGRAEESPSSGEQPDGGPVEEVSAAVRGKVASAHGEKPAISFAPVDGDWVSAPLSGMYRKVRGQDTPARFFSNLSSRRSDCIYRVRVVRDGRSSVYHFNHRDAEDATPLVLSTPGAVYQAFEPNAKFPQAFTIPASLIALLARQNWAVISPGEAAQSTTPPMGGAARVARAPVALEPDIQPVPVAPVLPLASPPSEPEATAVTQLQRPEVLGLHPVQDLEPERLVLLLEGWVAELEGFAARPVELISNHEIQRVVGQLTPWAIGAQIPDALHARLGRVHRTLIDKNNAYDRVVKGIGDSVERVSMAKRLKEIEAAVRCVGGLMMAIHDSRKPKRGFFSRFF